MDKKLNILTVDDDFINLKLLHAMLNKISIVGNIVESINGLDALNKLKKLNSINLILLDIKMPIMDGIEFMKNISTLQGYKDIPIIVLTTDETMKYEAFDVGAFDFLVKPIRERDLYEKIKKIESLL